MNGFTDVIYDVTMERTPLNTFRRIVNKKITDKSAACIVFIILFHLGRHKIEMLLHKIVISSHLIGKDTYSIANKWDQLTHKLLTPVLLVQCI